MCVLRSNTCPYCRRCDQYFDTRFDGLSATPLPTLPAYARGSHCCLGAISGPSGAAKSALLRIYFGSGEARNGALDSGVLHCRL